MAAALGPGRGPGRAAVDGAASSDACAFLAAGLGAALAGAGAASAAGFAAAFFAVGYLFDRDFDATETLQTVWLLPSYLLPVIVFFLAYWLLTLIVNRAGWWAHVLGGFIVALKSYIILLFRH